MYSSEIITRALLSGEAVYKTASLGFNGLMSLNLDRQRFYVITRITIEPFLNNLDALANLFGLPGTWGEPYEQNIIDSLKRTFYQLVVYNKDYNLRYSFKSDYSLRSVLYPTGAVPGQPLVPWTEPEMKQTQRKIDCFITTSQNLYFFLVFPNLVDPGALQTSTQPLNNFFAPTQPLPNPYGGPDPTLENLFQLQTNLAGGYIYVPVGVPNLQPGLVNGDQTSLINLPVDNFNLNGRTTQMVFPAAAGLQDLLAFYLPSFPVLQIDYIEFNQQPTSLGLFQKPEMSEG